MAIIEEPFSIWRLLRSLFTRPALGDEPKQPLDDPTAGDPSDPPPRDQETDDGSDQSEEMTEADDGDTLEVSSLGDPSTLSGFSYSVTNVARADDGDLWVEYLLICKGCLGGDMFSIIAYPKDAPDPSPDDDAAPAPTIHLAPCSARCIQCGDEKTIFDSRTAGYDGVLNGGSDDERGVDDPVDQTGAATVYVSLIYRAKLDELKDLAAKANVPAADIFGAIHIRGVNPHGQTVFEQQYECAS